MPKVTLFEKRDDCWTIWEHLNRKTYDGACGLDLLRDHGVEYSDDASGDIEVSMYGRACNPRSSINYILEAPVVCPDPYAGIYHEKSFLGRFTALEPNPDYVTKICGEYIKNTYKSQVCAIFDYKTEWENKDKFMVIFTSVQDFEGPFKNEYSLGGVKRRTIVKAAERYGDKFDFYGKKDDGCPNYRGRMFDGRRWDYPKMDCVAGYKFSICLENSMFDGYVTEKIAHSLNTRTIPIYYGAPNIKDYVPKELFIDMQDFETIDQCFDYVDSLSENKIKSIIEDIDSFVKDDKATSKISSLRLANDFVNCLKGCGAI